MTQLAEADGDIMKCKVTLIQMWSNLITKDLYLVKKLIYVDCIIKTGKKVSYYKELEEKEETLLNVCLTDIKELDKHSLEQINTYITPLGPGESRKSGPMFHNIEIQNTKLK